MKQLKQVTLLLLALLSLAACGEKNKPEARKPFVLKDNTNLYLNVAKTPMMKAETDTPEGILLSPHNIVKYAGGFSYTDKDGLTAHGALGDDQRDLVQNRIKMYAGMVIGPVPHMINGKRTDVYELLDGFIKARDFRLDLYNIDPFTTEDGVRVPSDIGVLAYIPNAKMEQAEKDIRRAWAEGDNEAVYKFFNDAYTFTPITDKEWNELKAKGEL